MPALDTNVLVRYVVEDDAAQLAAAKRLISRCVGEGLALFVPVTVVLEIEWVLRSNFAFPKDDVLLTLSSLFSAAELSFESERALEVALQMFRKASWFNVSTMSPLVLPEAMASSSAAFEG